jgi:hypothetical protein
MDFLMLSLMLLALFLAVSCCSDWALARLDPYSDSLDASFYKRAPRAVGRAIAKGTAAQAFPAKGKLQGLKRHDIQIRELPFRC